MTRKQVAIGGTFACDEALAVPLQYLLQNFRTNVFFFFFFLHS